MSYLEYLELCVVLDTTKVQIFKQITTSTLEQRKELMLFQIPQRYRFSSKSQLSIMLLIKLARCFRYHKGTDFQANHNIRYNNIRFRHVVLDTTKVQIFKQITTVCCYKRSSYLLFQIPQRYRFSSKSQLLLTCFALSLCCFRYHKGTDFQANHNLLFSYD